jgi:hypothetical protein
MVGLIRAIDRKARRHRYGVGAAPPGDVSAELGSLLTERPSNGIELRFDRRGRAFTPDYAPPSPPVSPSSAARWALAPLSWRDPEIPRIATGRAALRRSATASRRLIWSRAGSASRPARTGPVAGYLQPADGPGRRALYSSLHPVTGDQLLSTSPLEGNDMGYQGTILLGYLLERAPVTAALGIRIGIPVPWASRFGRRVRV